MNDDKASDRARLTEELEIARAKLRATGATVLSPTPEWTALQKQVAELKRKLK
jgi:hypothetical protein